MKILLTGYEGFIGRNLEKALRLEHEVLQYYGDIRYFACSHDVDLVIHLAAMTGVRSSWDNPDEYWDVNVTASKRIFDWCESKGVRVLYASSSSVHEWWLNPYAMSKKAMEELAPANSVGMRFHTVYGNDSRPDMFYDMLLNDKIEYLTEHSRDFTHIEDLISAVKILIANPQVKGAVDIGTGKSVKVIDVAARFGKGPFYVKSSTPGERRHTKADLKILRSLGFKPTHSILD